MRGDELLQKLSGIDADLIEAADKMPERKRRSGPMTALIAIAACFVFAVSIAFMASNAQQIQITIDGTPIGDQPLVLADPVTFARIPRDNLITFTIPLEISVKNKTVITITSGTMQVFDEKTGNFLYEGDHFEADTDVTINWTVTTKPSDSRFEMTVDGLKAGYLLELMYNSGSSTWSIRTQK